MRPEEDLGTSDNDLVAVEQGCCIDAMAFDKGSVGGTQVGRDHSGGSDAKFEVAARHAGVVDDDVGFGAATDDGDGFGEQPFVAVDVDDGVFGGGGRGSGGSSGTLKVDAENRRGPAAPATASSASPEHPIIDVDGEKWLLTEPVTVIGRGSEADIVVNDSGVSRRHLELRITPTGVIATDLGSTNGSFVEGHRIDAATLLDGNQIVIGRTKILFWTHPDQSGV